MTDLARRLLDALMASKCPNKFCLGGITEPDGERCQWCAVREDLYREAAALSAPKAEPGMPSEPDFVKEWRTNPMFIWPEGPIKFICIRCGTGWRVNADASWSLFDAEQKPGSCCDNSADFLAMLHPVPRGAIAKALHQLADAQQTIGEVADIMNKGDA